MQNLKYKLPNSPGHSGPSFADSKASEELGDFTVTPRVIPVALLAIVIGLVATLVAAALLRLIALFTNAFYYQRFSTQMVSPAANHLGWLAVLIPIAGALVIGFMAR